MQNADTAEQLDTPGLAWVEEFDDLTVDELRELPNDVQLGLDLSVFD
jgi:hypothetical protein